MPPTSPNGEGRIRYCRNPELGWPAIPAKLRFDLPARLIELTVTGTEGAMPMMVHSVGEVLNPY